MPQLDNFFKVPQNFRKLLFKSYFHCEAFMSVNKQLSLNSFFYYDEMTIFTRLVMSQDVYVEILQNFQNVTLCYFIPEKQFLDFEQFFLL
jgi:hypothetical protein